ncbi:long-chain fatty acid--CoA ligase [candidate division KSB1 bacterium]|nr:long-chain fatty acid--CoA ligase [candidate division KSB1 bacterium]
MIQFDWVEKWSQYAPDKIALREHESARSLTYAQCNNVANRLAARMMFELGLKKGDRVAILAENCLEFFMLFFTAQKTGIILVPLNYRLTAPEIDHLLHDFQPSLMITQQKYLNVVENCTYYRKINHQWLLEELQDFGYPRRDQCFEFPASSEIDEADPIFILYTAGTTGAPKGALYTHRMLFWNSINTTMRLDITSADRSVSCTPLFHTGGWNVIPTPFLHRGASFCLTQKFDADAILQLLQNEQATMFMGVPTMLQMMALSPHFEKINLEKMRFFIIGGEPMPLPLIEKWHKKGVPIRQGFGMTEAGPSITSLHQDDAIRKMGSIGMPNFYIQTRIVDDQGLDVAKNEVGELLLTGPSVTTGYWNNPQATAETISDGWLRTGDLMRQDEEGFLYVVDRKKFMYISGGENVYPAEVEKLLYTHPDIAEAAIIGIPDEKWGEAGKAFIVCKSGKRLTEEEVLQFCRGKLAKYKLPKYVRFLEQLPKNDAGKIDRKKLASF